MSAVYDLTTVSGRWKFLHNTFDTETFAAHAIAAHEANPEDLPSAVQCAEAFGTIGDFDKKLQQIEKVVERNPRSFRARLSLGLELLARGEYKRGWPYYRSRFAMQSVVNDAPSDLPNRRWRGQSIEGKSVFLVKEQGLGDTLQFVRYANKLQTLGARTYLNVQPQLRPLLRLSPAVGPVLSANENVDFHYWSYLQELLPFLNGHLSEVERTGAYISAPPRRSPFTFLSSSGKPLRIGLAWSGSPKFPGNTFRSVPLDCFRPLADLEGCELFSLMPPGPSAEISFQGSQNWITDLSGITSPFAELARAVAAMDVIVTVCTSIAHLAGSMGKPVVILLNTLNDWRWGRESAETPWYPSATLIRQKKLGEWSEPIEETIDFLSGL